MQRWSALCAVMFGAIILLGVAWFGGALSPRPQVIAASPPVAGPDSNHAESKPAEQVWSPLHAFLGIDPVTGQFKPPSSGPKDTRPPSLVESPIATEQSPAATANDSIEPNLQGGDMTLDELQAAVTKAINEQQHDPLASTLANLTRGVGSEPFSLLDPRIERIGYAIMFLYPLAIVVSELYGTWSRRRTVDLADADWRFYARQRNRRFMLAACAMGTIGLFWWAADHSFWWNDSQRLAGVVVGLTLLTAAGAVLRRLIARATKNYSTRVIEELRIKQLALEQEIRELRRQLQAYALTDSQ